MRKLILFVMASLLALPFSAFAAPATGTVNSINSTTKHLKLINNLCLLMVKIQ